MKSIDFRGIGAARSARTLAVFAATWLVVTSAVGTNDRTHHSMVKPYVVFAPRTFEQAEGWHQLATSFHDRVVEGTLFPPTVASTAPLAVTDVSQAGARGISPRTIPEATIRGLSSAGIVMLVSSSRRAARSEGPAIRPTRSPPLRLWKDTIQAYRVGWWRVPGTSMYEIHAHVRDRSLAQWLLREQVSIRLWFGSPLPSVTMLQAARSELDRLIMIHC